METKGKANPQDLQIQGLLDRYICLQNPNNNLALQDQHLDEDSLAAFTEGHLSQREAKPVISHLVNCSFCRHVTSELVRLDLALAGEVVQIAAVENQPSKISEVLNNLLSRIFGASDDAVFAHEEKKEGLENEPEDVVEDSEK